MRSKCWHNDNTFVIFCFSFIIWEDKCFHFGGYLLHIKLETLGSSDLGSSGESLTKYIIRSKVIIVV